MFVQLFPTILEWKELETYMNKIYHSDGTMKKWLRKMRSPVPSFYGIHMTPEIIYQEMMQSGKPVAWYEMLILSVISSFLLVLGLLSMAGVKWDVWVGVAGLIVTISLTNYICPCH